MNLDWVGRDMEIESEEGRLIIDIILSNDNPSTMNRKFSLPNENYEEIYLEHLVYLNGTATDIDNPKVFVQDITSNMDMNVRKLELGIDKTNELLMAIEDLTPNEYAKVLKWIDRNDCPTMRDLSEYMFTMFDISI